MEMDQIDLRYDAVSVWVDGVQRLCDRPRLEFIRELQKYAEREDWVEEAGSRVNKAAVFGLEDARLGYNCTIGAAGFGYETNEIGNLVRMPHLGYVVFGRGVRIGNNVCIDRAVLGSTIIGDNTKIDNLVHVAHGANIGRNCVIIAGSVIGGSVTMGDDVYVGIGAMIKNKIRIGDHAVIGMGAVVLSDVGAFETVVGNPARRLEKKG